MAIGLVSVCSSLEPLPVIPGHREEMGKKFHAGEGREQTVPEQEWLESLCGKMQGWWEFSEF